MLHRLPKKDPTNAERSRRARQRQKAGRIFLGIEADETMLHEALCAAGLIKDPNDDSHETIAAATCKLLEVFAQENAASAGGEWNAYLRGEEIIR